MATKKQTKADKAFIEKIGTIGISTGAVPKKVCQDCGHESAQVGYLAGEVNGQMIGGPVYGHPGMMMPRPRAARPVASSDEQSLSA
jgi:hypothetical protein